MLITLMVFIYIIMGQMIGRSSLKIYNKRINKGTLPPLLFPYRWWKKDIGSGEAFLIDEVSKDFYLLLATFLWPFKLIVNLPVIFLLAGLLITKTVDVLLVGGQKILEGGKKPFLIKTSAASLPEHGFEELAQLERQHQLLDEEIKQRRQALAEQPRPTAYRGLPEGKK